MMKAAHREWLLAGLLALSPLAYTGSLLIERALPERTNVATIDEAEALRIASRYAVSLGVDTEGWQSAVGTQSESDLTPFYRRVNPAALQGIAAPSTIEVLLQTANG